LFSKHVTRTVRTNTDYRLPYISCDFNDSLKYSRALIPHRTWWEALSIDITKVWRTKIEMSAWRKRKPVTFWDTAQNVRAALDSWELLHRRQNPQFGLYDLPFTLKTTFN